MRSFYGDKRKHQTSNRVSRTHRERQSKDLMEWIEKLNCCGKLLEKMCEPAANLAATPVSKSRRPWRHE
jgi:hypothetical protein